MPHVVPLGWRYNPELDVIDIGSRDFARTRKFHNAQRNPHVALVEMRGRTVADLGADGSEQLACRYKKYGRVHQAR